MNAKKTTRRRKAMSASSTLDVLKLSALATAISLLGALAISFFIALITLSTPDPLSVIAPISISMICLSSLSSGFISLKLCKQSPLLSGLLSGIILTAFILIVALFLRGDVSPELSTGLRVLMHVSPIPLATAGAFIARAKPSAKRRRRVYGR